MEFKNTFGVLHAHTDEIKKLLERLENSDKMRIIDVDLILERLRTVYDVISDLRMEVQSADEHSEQTTYLDLTGDSKEKDVQPAPDREPPLTGKEQHEFVEPETSGSKENRSGSVQEERVREDKGSVLSDRFKSDNRTINDEIGIRAKKEDLSSQLSTNPIKSLTGAIGLNEKFELINELFDGDKNKFDHTMQVLNAAGSFVEAYSYLEEKFDWDMENPYVQRILELIRRKLIVRRNES